MTKRKIPNQIVLAILILGCLGVWIDGWFLSSYVQAFQGLFICFFAALLFYAMRVMAAGDVKLCAALGFCIGFKAFFVVWLISLVVLLGYSILAFLSPGFFYKRSEVVLGKAFKSKPRIVPYGMVLAISMAIFEMLKRL